MEVAVNPQQTKTDAEIQDFTLVKLDGKFLRFASVASAPEGAEVITLSAVNEMTKEKIGELYGSVAMVNPKNFKDKKMAIASLVYQVAKMPVFDPNAPKDAPKAPVAAGDKAEKVARKTNETFELLSPPDLEKVLRELAPQAREIVLIMTELAKEKGSTVFSGADLNAKIKAEAARLRTKQDPLRILQYYKGKLIGSGLVRTS